jgi:hypothetical protein
MLDKINNASVNDKIITKKKHACGGNQWTILRIGADFKIRCNTCLKILMTTRYNIQKWTREII